MQQRRQADEEKALRASALSRKSPEELAKEAKAAREAGTLDRNKMWRSIRALSASQLKGWKLREWEEQQRRELGAKATKNNKVPLKIREGIIKKRKVVAARVEERLAEASVVTTAHKGNKKKRQRLKKAAAAAGGAGGGGGDGDAGDVGDAGVRGGVMNVSYLLNNRKKK